jgi:hypothetical protein
LGTSAKSFEKTMVGIIFMERGGPTPFHAPYFVS